ncbi:MAG: serine O-acetyltransferase EpsC [Christensenellales bacterium]|jgi:serine O-acetyltransferase|nr:serine O-acetyltransferase [Clostridiales bacterium]
MFKRIKEDIQAAMERDPAARSKFEVFMTYSGVRALYRHRRANWFFKRGHKLIARIISQRTKKITGIEIHPGATIGKGVFIDHGTGIVIGETSIIGDNCILYQGVTLGGTGKETGKRHPTLENNVMISAGATVLGAVTIGEHSKVGAGAVVLNDVPPYSTVVGIPGRVVRSYGAKVDELDQQLPDPVLAEFKRLHRRMQTLEEKCGLPPCDKSIGNKNIIIEEPCPDVANCKYTTCIECQEAHAAKPKEDN